MKNKKQKLLTGILVPVAALSAAGGVVGVIAGLQTKKTDDSTRFLNPTTITFKAGDGKFANDKCHATTFEAGTTLDRIDQPEVQSNSKRKIFAGWKNEKGEIVKGKESIKKNTTLTATYNDATSEYVTVTFALDPSQSGSVLQGNTRISVNKGYFFFMINRPTAKWTVTESEVTKNKYFKGWRYADTGEEVLENDVISESVTLYPIFNEAVTVTWVPHGTDISGKGGTGTIKRGQKTTTLETGTSFSSFNQPALHYVDAEGGEISGVYFVGWFQDASCTTPWSESTTITEDSIAYAKWDNEPLIDDKYGLVTFTDARDTDKDGNKLPTMTYEWTPTNQIITPLDSTTWGNTNKSTLACYKDDVLTKDYKVYSWEYCWSSESEGTYSTWTTLDDSYTFKLTEKYIKVRPVLTFAIDSLTVWGDDKVDVEDTVQYNVTITGGQASEVSNVVWSLVTEDGGSTAFPPAIAEINDSGVVTVKSCTRELYEQYGYDHFYVKAVSKLDSSVQNCFRVRISMPYTDNLYVWIHTEVSEPGAAKWYYGNIEDFCDTEAESITMIGMDGSKKVIEKSSKFVDTITFGTEIGFIPTNFLSNWTNFSGSIDFENSNVISIGENFLSGCTSFNSSLYLNHIWKIGPNFLKGCTSYNTAITFDEDAWLVEIGESFLHGCTDFNSVITLPKLEDLTIRRAFLFGCTSYNQDIVIPENVVSVEDAFMSECNAFTSIIEVKNDPSDNWTYADTSLSSSDKSSNIATVGFGVEGTRADEFKKIFTTLTEYPNYRLVRAVSWTGEVTDTVFAAAKAKLEVAYNLTVNTSLGTFEITNDSNDNDFYTRCKETFADEEGVYYAYSDPDARWIDHLYDEKGRYFRILSAEVKGGAMPITTMINNIHGLMTATSNKVADWTFDSENKWYTIDTVEEEESYRYTLKFSKSGSHDIEYAAKNYVDEETGELGKAIYAFTLSNIGTTVVDKPEALEEPIAPTWDGTSKYTVTTEQGYEGDDIGLKVKLTSTEYPTAFPSSMSFSLTDPNGGVITPKLAKTSLLLSLNESGDYESIPFTSSILNNKLVIARTDGSAFKDGDLFMLNLANPTMTDPNWTITAESSTARLLNLNLGKAADNDEVKIYSDASFSSEVSTGARIVDSSLGDIVYYVSSDTTWALKNPATYLNYGTGGSTIKIGDAEAVEFSTAGIQVEDVSSTRGYYGGSHLGWKVTIPQNTITDPSTINFAFTIHGRYNFYHSTNSCRQDDATKAEYAKLGGSEIGELWLDPSRGSYNKSFINNTIGVLDDQEVKMYLTIKYSDTTQTTRPKLTFMTDDASGSFSYSTYFRTEWGTQYTIQQLIDAGWLHVAEDDGTVITGLAAYERGWVLTWKLKDGYNIFHNDSTSVTHKLCISWVIES